METISHPFLADGNGVELSAPAAPAGTNLAAQFSIVWWDTPPAMIGDAQAEAFKAAILKQLPPGGLALACCMGWQRRSHGGAPPWLAA